MAKLVWRWLAACGATIAAALAAGAALAGSAWFSLDREKIVCDVLGTGTCTVELAWTVSKEDKFDKWKICWKEREASSWLDDHCEYHSKVRSIENNFYPSPTSIWRRSTASSSRPGASATRTGPACSRR
jgi:hypothetical protein